MRLSVRLGRRANGLTRCRLARLSTLLDEADNLEPSALEGWLADEGRTAEALALFDATRPWLPALEASDGLTAARNHLEESGIRRVRGDLAGALAGYERATRLYKSAEELPSTVAVLKFGHAQALLDLGRVAGAEAAFAAGRQVLRRFHLQSPTWREREAVLGARLLLARGNPASARQLLDAAAPSAPDRPGSMLQLLRCDALLASGQHDQAAVLATDELARAAGPPRAQPCARVRFGLLLVLGRARLAQDRLDEALTALQDAASASRTLHDPERSLDAAALQIALGQLALARR